MERASGNVRATRQPGALYSGLWVRTTLNRPGSGFPINSKVLRPMTTGFPQVYARKRRRSLGRCQGKPVSSPIRPRRSIAAMMETSMRSLLDRDLSGQRRMVAVVEQGNLSALDVIQTVNRGINPQAG